MAAATTESRIDETLLALADSTRRAILKRLSTGEARVTELAKPFDISLNAVSKHIRILERARLVRRRVEGREHFLAFNPKPLDETIKWLETQHTFWIARLDALEELLKAEDRMWEEAAKKTLKKKGKSR